MKNKLIRLVLIFLAVVVLLAIGWVWIALHWSYSDGERAGYVQKLSRKGWLCKTWEGEMAMVSMPGAVPEKFLFTVRGDAVAAQINGSLGKRVVLHYEEHLGLPTSCFGETRHFVTGVKNIEEASSPMQVNPAPANAAPPATAPAVPVTPAAPSAPEQPKQ